MAKEKPNRAMLKVNVLANIGRISRSSSF